MEMDASSSLSPDDTTPAARLRWPVGGPKGSVGGRGTSESIIIRVP